ncbi:MAG: dihydropteroate synthase [Gemmatimonadaceae bacterium]
MNADAPTPGRIAREWVVRGRRVKLDRPCVLGIVNVTPDSFSDGGKFFHVDAALVHAERLLGEGADILDIGGESTRPCGAIRIDAAEEIQRVIPVLRGVRRRWPEVVISIDTVKSEVAASALDEGADIINDVSGFRLDPGMADVCARYNAGVIIMHSRGTVSDMSSYDHATYGPDPTTEILAELRERVNQAQRASVNAHRIAVDPGIGFAKQTGHSLAILSALPSLAAWGYPVVVGVSRKRFIGEITGVTEASERVMGSVGANVMALALGARLFRVHDVHAARQALDVAWAIEMERSRA